MAKKRSSSRKSKFGLGGKWPKIIALVFGSAAIGAIATQYTGVNSTITSGGLGYLIGGVPVAIGALALGMLKGNGSMSSLTSLIGGQQHQSTPQGTVYG